MPARITSSASGTDPHGAGGRSSGAETRLGPASASTSCSTAASRPANGHPEETLTRHQPISIPIGPRRGRECQWPQPGRPRSSRQTRTHLKSCGAASIRRSSARFVVLDPPPLDAAPAAPRRRGRQARRAAPPARRGRAAVARRRPRRRGGATSTRPKASPKRAASSRSSLAICRRSCARARRSSTSRSSPRSSSCPSSAGISKIVVSPSPESERGHPQRLLDSDLRDPFDLDRRDRDPAAVAVDRVALAGGRRRGGPTGRDSSAIVSVPRASSPAGPGQRLAGGGVADAEAAVEPVGVEGAQGDPGLDDRDVERVRGQAVAAEAAVFEPLEGQLLDRGAGAVGVEADLAVEDAVGPRDRPFAQVDRLGAVDAVGEVAQAAPHRLGAAAGLAPRPRPRRCRDRGTRRRCAARPSPAAAPASSPSLSAGPALTSSPFRRAAVALEQALDPVARAAPR